MALVRNGKTLTPTAQGTAISFHFICWQSGLKFPTVLFDQLAAHQSFGLYLN